MHIRRLQIHGFKSFPEKTTFVFEPGISGIVGPNGCGKSNVVDALKWCLGEQSAKSLRGSAMQDVIFSGSDSRKASSSASVALTFARGENPFAGDFAHCDEVQITRSLKRDGTSDYLINQVKVRLKDIQDLFLDTGLNNRLYAIIEQGQIGQIINSRPQKTRELFEEAAGISRFKQRKEEALANLSSADDNLRQANMLVDQLNKQLRSLDRQAQKAMRFRRLRSRIRQLELANLFGVYIDKIEDRRRLGKDLSAAEAEEQKHILLTQSHEKSLKQSRDSLRTLQSKLNVEKEVAAECEANRREYESVLQLQSREVREREERIKILADRQADTDSAIAHRGQSLAELNAQHSRWLTMVKGLSVELLQAKEAAKDSERSLASIDKRLSEMKKQQLSLAADLSSKKTQQAELDLNQERGVLRVHELNAQEEQTQSALKSVDSDIHEISTQLSALQSSMKKIDDALLLHRDEEKKSAKAAGESERLTKTLQNEVNRSEHEMTKLRAKRSALSQMQDNYAGLGSNIKSLLSQSDKAHLLAELIDVPVSEQQRVYSLLGPLLELVVVETDDELSSLVEKLEGDALFVSLQDTDENCPDSFAPFALGSLGRRALNRLFGTALNATDVIDGLGLQRKKNTTVLVSEPPVLVAANGVIQKGLISPATAFFDRRRELEQLDSSISLAETKHEEISASHLAAEVDYKKALDNFKKSSSERQESQTQRAEINANINALTTAFQSYQRESTRLSQQQSRISDEIKKQNRMSVEFEARRKKLQKQIEDGGVLATRIEFDLSAAQEERLNEVDISTERQRKYSDLNAQLVGIKQRIAATTDQKQVLKEAQSQDSKRSQENQAEVKNSNKRIAFLRTENETIRLELKRLSTIKETHRATIAALEKQHAQAQHALIQTENTHAAVYAQKEKALTHRIRVHEALDKAKGAAYFAKSKLSSEFQFEATAHLARLERDGLLRIAPNSDVVDQEPPESEREWVVDFFVRSNELIDSERRTQWGLQISQLKTQMSGLGDVNLIALEEQKDIAIRHDSMLKQQQDLISSADRIRESIVKLDQLCIAQFRETYDRVNLYFSEIYPRLVGGGRAHLELTDPSDLLTTGVGIFAQPPGKRLQSLTLLSGGEKAMVAISLLFSLFRVKPSPFCVLDEVDAPLDEGNGARFNAMLSEMAEKSQFIVITHNKKTMEAADILYGVSMISPGISSLVSTKME